MLLILLCKFHFKIGMPGSFGHNKDHNSKMAPPHGSISPSQDASLAGSLGNFWPSIDSQFRNEIADTHHRLAIDNIDVEEAVLYFTHESLTDLLDQHQVLLPQSKSQKGAHKDSSIDKFTNKLATMKNTTRKSIRSDPQSFLSAVRLHHKAVKSARKMSSFRSLCNKNLLLLKTRGLFPNPCVHQRLMYFHCLIQIPAFFILNHVLIVPMVQPTAPFHHGLKTLCHFRHPLRTLICHPSPLLWLSELYIE